MNWKVTYRGRDGNLSEGFFDADSRESLFRSLSDCGISAIRVEAVRRGRASHRLSRRTIACALSLAFVALMACFVVSVQSGGHEISAGSTGTRPSLIKEVRPAVVSSGAKSNEGGEAAEQAPRMLTREEILKKPHWALSETERGVVDPSYPERHKQFLEEQAKIPWRTHVDRELALLLFPKDGNTGLLIPFDRKFVGRFAESIKTPTLVSKDDPDELKEKKRELNEVKAYLKARMDAGEDIVKLLNDEYWKLKKLYGLRESLKRELREYAKSAKSYDDIDDFVKAANIMLDNAGGRQIKLPVDIRIKKGSENVN